MAKGYRCYQPDQDLLLPPPNEREAAAAVHAANEVTRRGRETLNLMCHELAARGVTLLEADTDGVYFAVPEAWSEADERRPRM